MLAGLIVVWAVVAVLGMVASLMRHHEVGLPMILISIGAGLAHHWFGITLLQYLIGLPLVLGGLGALLLGLARWLDPASRPPR